MRSIALAVLCVGIGPLTAAAEAPLIEHAPVKCIVAGRYPRLQARFAPAPVVRARTYFRAQGIPNWYYVEMTPDASSSAYAGVLPRPTKKLVGQKIDYYVEAASRSFETSRTLEYDPLVVTRPEECQERLVAAYAPGPPLAVFPSLPGGFAVAGGLPTAAAVAVVGGGAAAAGTVVAVKTGDQASQPPATTAPVIEPAPPSAPAPTPPPPSTPAGGLEVSCRAQPQQGVAPLRVLFAAAASGGTSGYDFAWTFGDGETSSQVTPGHTYARPGTFQAEVVVTSGTATARCGRAIVTDAPTADFTLNVSRTGGGVGMVSGPGIDCGTDCSQIYGPGAVVSLAQAPGAGSFFVGWTGDCGGTGPCVVTMDAPRNVVAHFAANPTLAVSLNGTGTGTVAGPGIACGSDCGEAYPPGTVVTLIATPGPGSSFSGWSGDCTNRGSCTLTMDVPRTVVATFTPMATLQVTRAGTASGTVDGPGIACGSDCTEEYAQETEVTLTATPGTGATFAGWSGACTGPACTVTMNGHVNVTAMFNVTMVPLTIVANGDAAPFVSVVGPGINCGTDCTETYPYGSRVTLTVVPQPGAPPYTFPGWIGVGCSGTGPCQLTMTDPVTMLAIFIRLFDLSVGVAGSGVGRVVSTDGNINCPGTCSHPYPSSSPNVRLTAIPTAPSCFSAWTGDCSPQNPSPVCDLPAGANHSTTANFTAVCVAGNGAAATGGATASLNWSSRLESAEAWGRVLGNGVDAGLAPAGVTQLAIPKRAAANRVEAQLQFGAGQAGTWRFDLLDRGSIEAGSLRALEGEVLQVTEEAVVFRVSGRAGERVAFTFRTRG